MRSLAHSAISTVPETELHQTFDVVFDTSGSAAGFALAVEAAQHVVHLKSTHGKPVMSLSHLTSMVVDEVR